MLLQLVLLVLFSLLTISHAEVIRYWQLSNSKTCNTSYIDVSPKCPELTVLGGCTSRQSYMQQMCNDSCRLYFQYQDLVTAGNIINKTDLLIFNRPKRTTTDQFLWIVVTATTNLVTLPLLLQKHVLMKDHLIFERVLCVFTVIASFCYHFCESMDYVDRSHVAGAWNGLFIGQGKWHKLDNIGANLCFLVLLVHLTNYKKATHAELNKFIGMWLVFYCQEKNPWSMLYSVGPLLLQCVILVVQWTIVNQVPKINWYCLKRSIVFQSLAFIFFFKGLDIDSDSYRIYHGLWHCFSGVASIFHWQLIHSNREKEMYKKKNSHFSV